jgi:hypothetical protein
LLAYDSGMVEPQWDIEVELSDAEFRSFCRRWLWRAVGWSRLVHLLVLTLIAGAVTEHLSASRDRPFVLALIWLAVGHYMFESVLTLRAHMRYFVRQRKLFNDKVRRYHFDASGVSGTHVYGSFAVKWTGFEGIWRFRKVWALRIRGGGVLALPTRVLTDGLGEFILARALAFRPHKSVCLSCGYDIRGQLEARCPECGTAFAPELLKRSIDVQATSPTHHQ